MVIAALAAIVFADAAQTTILSSHMTTVQQPALWALM